MSQTVPLEKVPKDVSNVETRQVYNPLNIDFVHKFNGEEITLKAGKWTVLTAPVAVHLCKHLAKRIVLDIANKERAKLLKKTDSKAYVDVAGRPYPRFDKRAGDTAQLLIADVTEKDPEIDPEEILETAQETDQDLEKPKGEIVIPGKEKGKNKGKKLTPAQKRAKTIADKKKKEEEEAKETASTPDSSIANAMNNN